MFSAHYENIFLTSYLRIAFFRAVSVLALLYLLKYIHSTKAFWSPLKLIDNIHKIIFFRFFLNNNYKRHGLLKFNKEKIFFRLSSL